MAIINRTPDSFYDGGRTFALEAAVDAALQAADDGADWVDPPPEGVCPANSAGAACCQDGLIQMSCGKDPRAYRLPAVCPPPAAPDA
ncbi:dihydropteroate synthase [Arthrobacter sp. 35/47]|uniref:dihydropteroate synthase n=1 Tax=Arthrobacter sp. 35/47 TaxID=269454 RepID=UPI0031BA9F10